MIFDKLSYFHELATLRVARSASICPILYSKKLTLGIPQPLQITIFMIPNTFCSLPLLFQQQFQKVIHWVSPWLGPRPCSEAAGPRPDGHGNPERT